MEQIANYIELHYYLQQHGHAMDARTFNKAEAEILKIMDDLAKQLDIKIQINILPKKEGGLESFYEFISKPENAAAFAAVATPLALFFGRIVSKVLSDVIAHKINTNKESEELKKENLRLQNEEIKKRLLETKPEERYSPETISMLDNLAIYLAEANKVKIAKSNFYKHIKSEAKVIKFSTRAVNSNLEPIEKENSVPRPDFTKFIIDEANVEPSYEHNREIPVVAPILKNSKSFWRGVINEKEKTFAMKDKRFQRDVVARKYSFENGSILVCDLETRLSIDKEGNIKEKGYAVYDVTQVIYPTGEIIDVLYEQE